jgi:hypothetical protein
MLINKTSKFCIFLCGMFITHKHPFSVAVDEIYFHVFILLVT